MVDTISLRQDRPKIRTSRLSLPCWRGRHPRHRTNRMVGMHWMQAAENNGNHGPQVKRTIPNRTVQKHWEWTTAGRVNETTKKAKAKQSTRENLPKATFSYEGAWSIYGRGTAKLPREEQRQQASGSRCCQSRVLVDDALGTSVVARCRWPTAKQSAAHSPGWEWPSHVRGRGLVTISAFVLLEALSMPCFGQTRNFLCAFSPLARVPAQPWQHPGTNASPVAPGHEEHLRADAWLTAAAFPVGEAQAPQAGWWDIPPHSGGSTGKQPGSFGKEVTPKLERDQHLEPGFNSN